MGGSLPTFRIVNKFVETALKQVFDVIVLGQPLESLPDILTRDRLAYFLTDDSLANVGCPDAALTEIFENRSVDFAQLIRLKRH